jgi:hypothetical protein
MASRQSVGRVTDCPVYGMNLEIVQPLTFVAAPIGDTNPFLESVWDPRRAARSPAGRFFHGLLASRLNHARKPLKVLWYNAYSRHCTNDDYLQPGMICTKDMDDWSRCESRDRSVFIGENTWAQKEGTLGRKKKALRQNAASKPI